MKAERNADNDEPSSGYFEYIAGNESAILGRLLRRSANDGECLVWTGSLRGSSQYGVIGLGGRKGRQFSVHRVAWMARHGDIPPETPNILHHCDNPPCFRDEHLYAGTQEENVRDRDTRGRNYQANKTHCDAGHLLSGDNLRVDGNGHRVCKQCHRDRTTTGIGSGGHNRMKTHCVNGHEYTPENTRLHPNGRWRRCLTCDRIRDRARRRKE